MKFPISIVVSALMSVFCMNCYGQLSIGQEAQDLILECNSVDDQMLIDAWLNLNGQALATSPGCEPLTWSNVWDPNIFYTGCSTTGLQTIDFTVVDNCGNQATTSAIVLIEDTTPPIFTESPTDQIVECDGAGNTQELVAWLDSNGGAVTADDCGYVTWTHDFQALSDDCGSTGSALVIFLATDECGNYSTSSAEFTIEDTTYPSIDVEAQDLVIACDIQSNQLVIDAWLANNGGAASSDICDTEAIVWSHDYVIGDENTDCGASGALWVTFTATDNCGLFSTTTATLEIIDLNPPSITTNPNDLDLSGSDNYAGDLDGWLLINGGAQASDNCSEITWTDDFSGLSTGGGCNGSSTIVIFTATDDCGNETTSIASILTDDVGENGGGFSCTIDSQTSDCSSGGGVATAITNGGTPPFTYSWSNGQTTQEVGNLPSGNYIVSITDAEGCMTSSEINISLGLESQIFGTSSSCGQANGFADVLATGGVEPYTYSWSHGETGMSISNLAPGTYTCQISDVNGCTATNMIEIIDEGGCIDPGTCDDLDCTNGIEAWDCNVCDCVVLTPSVLGCTDPDFCEYNPDATCDDGSCYTISTGQEDCNQDCTLGNVEEWDVESCSCIEREIVINGCTNPDAFNYNAEANCDDGSCAGELNIYIPNIVSKEDEISNTILIAYSNFEIELVSFRLYDRWGNLMISNTPNQKSKEHILWEFDNASKLIGVFVYQLEYKVGNTTKDLIGNVTIIE